MKHKVVLQAYVGELVVFLAKQENLWKNQLEVCSQGVLRDQPPSLYLPHRIHVPYLHKYKHLQCQKVHLLCERRLEDWLNNIRRTKGALGSGSQWSSGNLIFWKLYRRNRKSAYFAFPSCSDTSSHIEAPLFNTTLFQGSEHKLHQV